MAYNHSYVEVSTIDPNSQTLTISFIKKTSNDLKHVSLNMKVKNLKAWMTWLSEYDSQSEAQDKEPEHTISGLHLGVPAPC